MIYYRQIPFSIREKFITIFIMTLFNTIQKKMSRNPLKVNKNNFEPNLTQTQIHDLINPIRNLI